MKVHMIKNWDNLMVCHLAMMVLYDVPYLHYGENVIYDQNWEDFITRELISKNCKEAKMVVILILEESCVEFNDGYAYFFFYHKLPTK